MWATRPVHYYFSDHLNSTNLVYSASGTLEEDSDFYPYGGERAYTLGSGNHFKFTGKERDPESGLDYFGARYYGNSLGRFLTPDWAAKPVGVPYAQFGDPQSLNLYAHVRNNPVMLVDVDGHEVPAPWSARHPNQQITDEQIEAENDMALTVASFIPYGGAAASLIQAGRSYRRGDGVSVAANLLAVIPMEKVLGSVWKLGNFARGIAIERMLGGNLPHAFPVIDKFIGSTGIATSIKSLDLGAKAYQDTAALGSKINGYVDMLANFKGATRGGVDITESMIKGKVLELAVPKGAMSAAQKEVIDEATKRAAKMGVTLKVVEIK